MVSSAVARACSMPIMSASSACSWVRNSASWAVSSVSPPPTLANCSSNPLVRADTTLLLGLQLLPLGAQGRGLAFDVAEAALAGAQLIHGQPQLELFQVLPLRLVLPRLIPLALQRIPLPAHLADNVHDPDEVLLRLIEAAHRFLLLGQVFGNPAGFLEDHPALLRLRGEHHIDVALLDDCVGAAAQARPEEQLLDVAQTAGRLVDEAFALPGAVDPPGDGDFGEIDGQQALLVADRQRDLRYRERGPLIRAVEDDVLEAGGADVAGVVLAEHPPDGVYHITFATAFWPDDW